MKKMTKDLPGAGNLNIAQSPPLLKRKKQRNQVLGALDPNARQDPHLLKLCEILMRGLSFLQAQETQTFLDFYPLYSMDVEPASHLLKKCTALLREQRVENSAQLYDLLCPNLNSRAYKPQPGDKHPVYSLSEAPKKLSVLHQCELLIARWKVYNWILKNQDPIKWLYRRREIVPLVLATISSTAIQVENRVVSLPPISIEWLVELVYPCLWSKDKDKEIAVALCNPDNHSRVIGFSAQMGEINRNLSLVMQFMNDQILKSVNFFFDNIAFFNGLMGASRDFNPIFIDYLRVNSAASKVVTQLCGYHKKLYDLATEPNAQNLISDPEKLEKYAPVFKVLVNGMLSGHFELWLELSQIDITQIENDLARRVMLVAGWFEKYREVIASSFDANSQWAQWISNQNRDRKLVAAFSEQLNTELQLLNDVRPCKSTGDSQTFPDALVCFMDCFTGLSLERRNSEVSCGEKDVQLYQFLKTPLNFSFVTFIEGQREALSRIFDQYLADQNQVVQQLMAATLDDPELQPVERVAGQAMVEAEVPEVRPRRERARDLMSEFDEAATSVSNLKL